MAIKDRVSLATCSQRGAWRDAPAISEYDMNSHHNNFHLCIEKQCEKISKQATRGKAVGNVLATLRIEQLTPGDYVVKGMNACMSGKETAANVLQEVMR